MPSAIAHDTIERLPIPSGKERAQTATVDLTLYVRPDYNPRSSSDRSWVKEGFLPMTRVSAEIPKDMLPEVARIEVVRRFGQRVFVVRLEPPDLTLEEQSGAGLAMRKLGVGVVTREEARAAYADWAARGMPQDK